MKSEITIETLRARVQRRVAERLQNRSHLQPFTRAELNQLRAIGRSQLCEDFALLDQEKPLIDAETREAEAALTCTPLSTRLRQFLYDTYERGTPPWTSPPA